MLYQACEKKIHKPLVQSLVYAFKFDITSLR